MQYNLFSGLAETEPLRAPFPWFGAKSSIAELVWDRLGDVPNYVEPFFGSGAVLLGRPWGPGKFETVNDVDCAIVNFWRAVQCEPDAVAEHACNPIFEADMRARSLWVQQSDVAKKVAEDPGYYDARAAGYWVWGVCISGDGNRSFGKRQVQAQPFPGPPRGILHKGLEEIVERMRGLQKRLERVRVLCGNWDRVLGCPATVATPVGVFLDPPYAMGPRCRCYASDSSSVARETREWAISHGNDASKRIVLCGYQSDPSMPDGWTWVDWHRVALGYSGNSESRAERVWFSPHCLSW
jgi:DNA adenine methylase